MAKSKKHIQKGDIVAIVIAFALAIFSIFTSKYTFFAYYSVIALLRLMIVVLQALIVRKDDDPQIKFKKERRLCRLVGLLLIAFDLLYSSIAIIFILKEPSEFFQKFPVTILVYVAYAVYKFVTGYIHLKKARRSWSPYREIICCLSFFDAMIAILNSAVLLLPMYSSVFVSQNITTVILSILALTIAIITFIMAIKLIKSRKIPNLLK